MAAEIAPKSREELELEHAIFGDAAGFESELAKLGMGGDLNAESDGASEESSDDDQGMGSDDDLYFIDKGAEDQKDGVANNEDDESQSEVGSDEDSKVWSDSDDDASQINLTATDRTKKLRKSMDEVTVTGRDYERRLRSHFESLYPKPSWARSKAVKRSGSSETESDVSDEEGSAISANPLKDLLEKKTNYTAQLKSRMLPTSDLDIQRLADVTKQLSSQAVVQTIEFHPNKPLVLTGGFDQTLRIYQIDGKHNPVATSLHIENCPFRTALFHPDGKRVIAAGRRRYMFIWDLETGSVEKISRLYGHEHTQSSFEKFILSPDGEYIALAGDNGWMNLLGAHSGQWVAGAKIEGEIVDFVWTEGSCITLINKSGDIWVWDSSTKHFKSRWRDPSLVGVTCLAQSTHWLAVGMDSGIVSVYSRQNPKIGMRLSDSEPESRDADQIVENLVTSISSMRFNPDGQMLAISSKLKKDALRIVHVPSFSVFKNWPTSSTPLGHVSCIAWSPQNQMLAAGNEGGYARLWALNHYSA